MKMRIRYTTYPQSPKLTNKSKRVATLTHPLYGVILGGMIGVAAGFAFPDSVTIPMIFLFGGAVAGPILLALYRKKKFAQFDAEYDELLKSK